MKNWPNICKDTWVGIINGEGKLGKTIFVVNPIYFCLWHVFCQKNCTQVNPNLINFMFSRNVFEILSTKAAFDCLFSLCLYLFSPSCLNLNLKRFNLNLSISITSKQFWASRQLKWAPDAKAVKTFQQQFCLPGSAECHCKWFVSASLCLCEEGEQTYLI